MLSPFGVPMRHFTEENFEEVFDNTEVPPGRRRPPRYVRRRIGGAIPDNELMDYKDYM